MKYFRQQYFAAQTPSTEPSAAMIAFPQARRVHAVARIAERMAGAKSRERGEHVLAVAIRTQRAAMTRKGIATERVDCECARLESAVRTRLWTIIFSQPSDNAV